MTSKHEQYIEEVEKTHNSQMHAARLELERLIEISKHKVLN